ncbi:MAG: DUF4870 domain-containing protein [Halothece sp.]
MANITPEEIKWAMICHVAGLVWIPLYWLQFPLPLINVIIVGVVWLFKREESEYIDFQGREALNFQIALFLYSIVFFVIGIIGFFIYLAVFGAEVEGSVGAIALLTRGINETIRMVSILMTIWSLALAPTAAMKAKKGQFYFYPLTIRVLK